MAFFPLLDVLMLGFKPLRTLMDNMSTQTKWKAFLPTSNEQGLRIDGRTQENGPQHGS